MKHVAVRAHFLRQQGCCPPGIHCAVSLRLLVHCMAARLAKVKDGHFGGALTTAATIVFRPRQVMRLPFTSGVLRRAPACIRPGGSGKAQQEATRPRGVRLDGARCGLVSFLGLLLHQRERVQHLRGARNMESICMVVWRPRPHTHRDFLQAVMPI